MNTHFKWHKEPFLVLEAGYVGHITKEGYSLVASNRKYGLIDFDGNLQLPMISDEPLQKKGLVAVKKDRLIGLINANGDTIYPCKAESFRYLDPGFYALTVGSEVLLFREDGSQLKTEFPIRMLEHHEFTENALPVEVWLNNRSGTAGGYIDTNGNSLMEFKYRYNEPFENGIAAVRGLDYTKTSYIDKKGNTVFECPADWISIKSFDGPLAMIQSESKKGFAFIDRNFNLVVEPQFNVYQGRCNSFYIVSKDSGTGAIDSTGKAIIPFEYSGIKSFTATKVILSKLFFKDPNASPSRLWDQDNTYFKYAVWDLTKQQLALPFQYQRLESAGNGCLIAQNETGQYAYLNEQGQPLTGFEFERTEAFHHKRAWVKMNGKWGIIELR